jgi:hypothetical protein
MTARSVIAAALVTGCLLAAGCGGDSDATESQGIPESGTRPETTTTVPEETTTTTATTTGGSGDGTGTTTTVPAGEGAEIQVEVEEDDVTVEWRVDGGAAEDSSIVEVDEGTPVTLTVTADRPDVVRVHGIGLTTPLQPGTPGTVQFVASIPGLYLVELQQSHLLLAQLQVD